MANEYAVNHADLKAVAKAIRDKGKTTEVLTFPVGFISAVEAISGGGLNFEVVGGTEQPESPAENTIWANTSTEIGKWAYSAEAPESPDIGDLWLVSDLMGNTIDLTDDNVVLLAFSEVKQYTSNGWKPVTGKIYADGVWTDIEGANRVIFDGEWHYGYTAIKASGGTFTITDPITITGGTGFYGFYLSPKVDVTDYTAISIEWELPSFSHWAMICISTDTVMRDYNTSTEPSFVRYTSTQDIRTDLIPTGAYSGEYFIKFMAYGDGTAKIHNITLIK